MRKCKDMNKIWMCRYAYPCALLFIKASFTNHRKNMYEIFKCIHCIFVRVYVHINMQKTTLKSLIENNNINDNEMRMKYKSSTQTKR